MSNSVTSIGIEEIQLVPSISLDVLSSESLGLIAGYCELQHVALLFCCGSRLLNAKLSSRTGAQSIQSTSHSRREWNRFPALLGQLKGLKAICLESFAPLTSVGSWWSDLMDLLPMSIEDLSLTILGSVANIETDLLNYRIQTLKTLSLSFENSPSDIFEFPFQDNWSDCLITKLVFDFRFLVPSSLVLVFPSTLTDLSWGGESDEHPKTCELASFEGCKHLIRLRLPFVVALLSHEAKLWFPVTLKCLEIPKVLKVHTIKDGTIETWIVNSLAFSILLPPNLEHFESAGAVKWSCAPCNKTMISWKIAVGFFEPAKISEFPSNLQAFIVAPESSTSPFHPDSTNTDLLALLPQTITDLRISRLRSADFIDTPLPPRLTRLRMSWNPASPFRAYFPTSLTSLHLETPLIDPKIQPTESIRQSTTSALVSLPPHITHFSTSAARFVKLSQRDKLAFNLENSSNWVSPLLIVANDRIDLMYECFERGRYHESDFEDWDPLMGAIKHGSLKFLKWALSRHFMTSYHFFTAREGPNSRALLLTAISNGQLEVIEMLESKGFDTSFPPTSSAITGAIQSNRPEILAWLTKRGIDFTTLELNTGPLAHPLTIALNTPCRASAEYLLSVGCVSINFMSFLLKEPSLDVAHELGLFAPFETPENVANFIKHWNPALLPSAHLSASGWDTWLKTSTLQNPPLRFHIMFLLRTEPSRTLSIFQWMSRHGYWDPLELIEPNSPILASVSASEPTKGDANGSHTSSKTNFAPTLVTPITRRTIISFYLEFLSQYSIGDSDSLFWDPMVWLLDWLFDRDPLIERLRFGDNKTIFDFMGPAWTYKSKKIAKSQLQSKALHTAPAAPPHATMKSATNKPPSSSSTTSDALPNPTPSIVSQPKTGFKSSATFGTSPAKFGAKKPVSSPPSSLATTTTFGTPAFKTKLGQKK